MTPKFATTLIDEYGTRVFFSDASGYGLFVERRDGWRQLVGTCDAGPFRSARAFRSYVVRKFSSEDIESWGPEAIES